MACDCPVRLAAQLGMKEVGGFLPYGEEKTNPVEHAGRNRAGLCAAMLFVRDSICPLSASQRIKKRDRPAAVPPAYRKLIPHIHRSAASGI